MCIVSFPYILVREYEPYTIYWCTCLYVWNVNRTPSAYCLLSLPHFSKDTMDLVCSKDKRTKRSKGGHWEISFPPVVVQSKGEWTFIGVGG